MKRSQRSCNCFETKAKECSDDGVSAVPVDLWGRVFPAEDDGLQQLAISGPASFERWTTEDGWRRLQNSFIRRYVRHVGCCEVRLCVTVGKPLILTSFFSSS